ncbi:NADH-quinone oxidoreductase subunit NuoH [Limnochorda pilosa]|uniref:NADH-quinone oxidoreductase subunit H n=1 Tax=Limnochorda pilosa TaxID=1555112 RepID=A0A0K2SKQ2_LIMPI|nr:NADH-quinone oxidoreductase subunit NuoH [Limnochorda pilosa]BAS27665.1 NADH:ubiquinone oxidoreductase subunit H [Limnochorda pilosa]
MQIEQSLVQWVAGLYAAGLGWWTGLGIPGWVWVALMAILKAAGVLVFILLNVLFLIWLERKVAGHIQRRPGPMHNGPHGALQTLADAVKLIIKEDIIPSGADKWVFIMAPFVMIAPALMIWVVMPFGPQIIGRDLNIGILYVSAVSSFAILALMMAGWSSNNKWSTLGAMRSAAQMISYEIPLGLALVAIGMVAGTLSLEGIVEAQRSSTWFLILQPLGFLVFIVAATAEINRSPFNLPEAESELVAGFNTEYSGFRWGVFFVAEYANLLATSGIAATLFLGGWSGPAFLPPFVWWLLKTYLFVFIIMWVGWTVPRIRVDQLMELGWKFLIPVGLANIALTGVYVILT